MACIRMHFKPPPAQGWALKCFDSEVAVPEQKETKRIQYRRRQDGLDQERERKVSKSLDILFTGVVEGSEKLYDGLWASFLD